MKVLIAEDDVNIREGVVELLEKEGYEVSAASNGKEAVDCYSSEKPDFLILDIMMPEMSGYDVCRKIRQDDQNTPILFLSAKSEEIDKVVGLELGGDDFVSKPFGSRELMARVRAISRRMLSQKKEEPGMQSFCMGSLELFPSELRARRGSDVVDLSLRDVLILKLLFREKGNVVDRRRFFRECWGDDFVGTTRTLDQHISQLRKKIEEEPKNPEIIKTVHGIGYRFEG
ncbi:MAG: response regulator transcription factor [Fibrobacteria bacterium]|nr:response regulator transcription factor [Fibrobacteria bacterium]